MIPKKIKVFHLEFTIEEVPESFCIGCWGWCDVDAQKIFLCESMSLSRKREILLHEVLHAILSTSGPQEKDEEEIFVKLSGVGLILISQDNPKLIEFLFDCTINPHPAITSE